MVPTIYALALTVVTTYGIYLFALSLVRMRTDRLIAGEVPEPDEMPDARPNADELPAVTVQLPIYNEALVARRLIDACARMRYPKDRLDIQVLDDSTDETVGIVDDAVLEWRRRGVRIAHLRRTRRTGFKAGALEAGLRATASPLVALFDADFVPDPDFLLRTVPRLRDPEVAMVQARWTFLNEESSALTRLQAFGLDAHFAVEQTGRHRSGCFMAFNGTAGVWRAEAIRDAGGWSADTLTEDLDLSFRAQLRGWRLVFDDRVTVPSELPVEMTGFRVQQRRWTIGSVQTARKLLRPLLRSRTHLRVRAAGALQLCANLVYPCVLLLLVFHAPLALQAGSVGGPHPAYFAALGLGLLGLAGFVVAHLTAQRALHADAVRRMSRLPLFLVATMGLALQNTLAVASAARGRGHSFDRTPKFDARGRTMPAWWRSSYVPRRVPVSVWGELLLAGYCVVGLVALVWAGAWAFVPFQAAAVAGTGWVPGLTVSHVYRTRRVAVD